MHQLPETMEGAGKAGLHECHYPLLVRRAAYIAWANEYLSDPAIAHIPTALKSWTEIKVWV